jgi:hypothetical protein
VGDIAAVDDDTISSGALVAEVGFAPSPTGAQVLVGGGIKPGDSTSVPDALARFGARVRPGQNHHDLVLVAVLWDKHDTPFEAVLAGYDAFLAEIREATAQHLIDLSGPGKDAAEAAIKTALRTAVENAIKAKLSTADDTEIFLGIEQVDALIDSSFFSRTVDEHDSTFAFALAFGAGSPRSYEIDGQFMVTADPCENQAVRVSALQQQVANIRGALQQLNAGGENPAKEKQIEKLEAELVSKQAELDAAEADLTHCREGFVVGSGGRILHG